MEKEVTQDKLAPKVADPKVIESFVAPAKLMNDIFTYLVQRPYLEVEDLITRVKKDVVAIYKDEKKEDEASN